MLYYSATTHLFGLIYIGIWKFYSFNFLQNSEEMMKPICFVYQNATIIEQPYDPRHITNAIVKDSVEFISESNDDSPFFLYVNPIQAHFPLLCSGQFCNSSKRGNI